MLEDSKTGRYLIEGPVREVMFIAVVYTDSHDL